MFEEDVEIQLPLQTSSDLFVFCFCFGSFTSFIVLGLHLFLGCLVEGSCSETILQVVFVSLSDKNKIKKRHFDLSPLGSRFCLFFRKTPTSCSVCLPVCLSVCLPICLPICLSVCLSVCLPACLPACLSVRLPACLPAFLPACLSVSVSGGNHRCFLLEGEGGKWRGGGGGATKVENKPGS